jgi:hypothetical protein
VRWGDAVGSSAAHHTLPLRGPLPHRPEGRRGEATASGPPNSVRSPGAPPGGSQKFRCSRTARYDTRDRRCARSVPDLPVLGPRADRHRSRWQVCLPDKQNRRCAGRSDAVGESASPETIGEAPAIGDARLRSPRAAACGLFPSALAPPTAPFGYSAAARWAANSSSQGPGKRPLPTSSGVKTWSSRGHSARGIS